MYTTDRSYRNKYKILRGGVINNFHLENPTRQLQGQNTPASIITLINNSKASGSCCPIPTPIEATPIVPIPVVINLAETTLVYSTDQGSEIDWDESIFTRNTDLPNFSYSAIIASLSAATRPPDYNNVISVRIGNTVTSINDSGFQNYRGLTSITIGNSVTSIGGIAFAGCRALTSIIIPNSVTSIGENAFFDCRALISITIPDSVTNIAGNAFDASGLANVYISSATATTLGITSPATGVSFFGRTVTTYLP